MAEGWSFLFDVESGINLEQQHHLQSFCNPDPVKRGCYGPCYPRQATPGYQIRLSLHPVPISNLIESTDSRSLSHLIEMCFWAN